MPRKFLGAFTSYVALCPAPMHRETRLTSWFFGILSLRKKKHKKEFIVCGKTPLPVDDDGASFAHTRTREAIPLMLLLAWRDTTAWKHPLPPLADDPGLLAKNKKQKTKNPDSSKKFLLKKKWASKSAVTKKKNAYSIATLSENSVRMVWYQVCVTLIFHVLHATSMLWYQVRVPLFFHVYLCMLVKNMCHVYSALQQEV